MNKTRLLMFSVVLVLSLVLVGVSLAADTNQKDTPPSNATGMTIAAPGGGQTDSLSGSVVTFDPSVGGDTCYLPGNSQTFCFRAESFTSDFGYVYNLWEKFPTDWNVTNVYVQGTPSCDSGAWGTFSWSFQTSPYEVNINHPRYQSPVDDCVAYYCFDVVAGSGTPDALESWYWAGDNYGSPPYHPCSADVYTPGGQTACDESVNPQAAIPPCELSPIMLTPLTQDATGCGDAAQDYTVTVWNNAGYDTTVDLTYSIIAGAGTCTGPASVDLADGTTTDITVSLTPEGSPGDIVECQVYAEDIANPGNNATATVAYTIISGGIDPAGWQLETNVNALGAQWDSCAVGTNPSAAGEVGYQVAGLNSVGGVQANLQMYDPNAAAWTQLAPAPDNFFGQVAGWIDGKLYVAGGLDATFAGYNDLEVYDPVTNTWDNTTPANLPVNRGGVVGGVAPCHTTGVGDCLYSMGGTPDGNFTSFTFNAYEYDPLTNIWTQLDPIPGNPANSGMALGGGVACAGQIFAGGDYRGIADFFKFDPATGVWTQIANIPAAAGKMTPAMVCKPDEAAIYLIGGDSLGGWGDLFNNKVFRYSINTDTWEGPIPQTLNQGLLGSCGLYMDSKLWTFGGTNGSNAITPAPHESLAFISCGPAPVYDTSFKLADPLVVQGNPIHYTIVINNTGTAPGLATTMTDLVPAGTTFMDGSLTCDSGTCSYDVGTNIVSWEGEVGPGGVQNIPGAGIDDITGSTVNFIAPDTFSPAGDTVDLCFNVTETSDDFEYLDGFDFTLPADWTVNTVYDTPGDGIYGHTFGVLPGNLVYWYTNGMPSGYGDWSPGTYDFCANITVPAGCSVGWEFPWNIWGDQYGAPPNSVSGTAAASCEGGETPSTVTIEFDAIAETCQPTVENIAFIDDPELMAPVVVTASTDVECVGEPDITVDPLFLDQTLFPDEQATQTLNVCNVGTLPLEWNVSEAAGKMNVITLPASTVITKTPQPVTLSLESDNKPGTTAPAPAAPEGAVSLVLDDGSRENDIGIGGTLEFIFLNRFTPDPSEFPFALNQVQVYFSSVGLVNVGDNIILEVYENTTGNTDPAVGSTWLASFPTTVQAVDAWNVYNLPSSVTLNGPGDVLVGVIALEVPGTSYWPASIDQTVSHQRSWAGWWTSSPPPVPPLLPPDSSWTLIDAYFPGNWMVRGYGETIVSDVLPWLSEDPTSGTILPGDCQIIDVTFDSTGLTPDTYLGSLNVNSNDPDTPVVNVPVTLTVVPNEPDIVVTPTLLELTLNPGEIGMLNFTIDNIGTGDLTWSLTDNATWLSELPTSGTIIPDGSTTVDVTFDSAGLAYGVHTATITITSNDPDTPTVTIQVTLTVNSIKFFLPFVHK